MNELKRSSLIILRKYVLTCRKVELAAFVVFFFPSGSFFFMNIMIHRTAGEGVGSIPVSSSLHKK